MNCFTTNHRPLRQSFIFCLILTALLTFLWSPAFLFAQDTGITGDDTINKCETKRYTISILNNSSNPLTEMTVTNNLTLLTGFSYEMGSTSIDVNGGAPFCTVDPVITPGSGGGTVTWDIDDLCSTVFTLEDGETLNISFELTTDCTAVSASMNVDFNYLISGTPSSDSDAKSIQVLPGGVTIKKTPNVTPGKVGDHITWTLTVENAGLGVIENVMVTDVLGAGLQYADSTGPGVNSGQTTTWSSTEIPALASMVPGAIVTLSLEADIIACENLDNTADVQWGCGSGVVCFNTATDGGTATASIEHLVTTPLISFTPPDITFNYCESYADVSFVITNLGDGAAYNLHSIVDLSEFTITNVSAGASYDGTQFILSDPIPPAPGPGNSYTLSFRANYNTWCGVTFPTRDILWQKIYQDGCGHDFYPPVELSQINPPGNTTALVTAKTGAPAVAQIGDQVVYTISSSYNGPLSCGSGNVGTVTVTDILPDGFTVETPIANGGVWTPGAGGTGGTVVWTYTPPATLNTTLTVNIPNRTFCDMYCYTSFTNSVNASATDCCGCLLTDNDAQTTAIECAEGVDSEKTWAPATTTERCNNIMYTNTYTFEAGSVAVLSDLRLVERAENHQLYDSLNGPVTVLLDGGALPGGACYILIDNTGSDNGLIIDFSGCPATALANHTLTISYQLTVQPTTVNACTGGSFLSWTSLTMASGGGECLPDGTIHEATQVTIPAPSMAVSVSGLGEIIHKCETQEITLTFRQTSAVQPHDARLVLSGLNYYVVDPGAVTGVGVAPVSGNFQPTIVGDDYVWYFGDNFIANGDTATITIDVQKRCEGLGNLDATGYFDDNCADDANYDDTCNVTASETPALLLSGDLLIEKTPEVYYAASNTAEWKIYVTNRGTGTAFNVWVDDELGSGLQYNSASVDDMTGVTVTANQDHNGAAINGATIALTDMTAGERRTITFRADIIDCDNLTNDVSTSWGCIGQDCQVARTDRATVEIPAPLLIHSNVVTNPVDACSDPSGSIIVRNAGQTTCYNVNITETLPSGLLYVPGTTRYRVNGGAWNGPDGSYNPSSLVSPLTWDSTSIPALASLAPGDTVELDFDFSADCPFSGGLVTIATRYENPCGQVFNVADSNFNVTFHEPTVTVTKTADNNVLGCGDNVTWTITVQNTSGYELPIIWVHDALDAAYTFTGSTGDATYIGDNGTNSGQNVYWEIRNLPHNGTATMTLSATTDSAPCSANMDNNVATYWGCGVSDGFSNTHPADDEGQCLTAMSDTADNTPSRQPDLAVLGVSVTPNTIDSCNDNTEVSVTIQNNGRTAARDVDLVLTLPAGLSYIPGSASITCGGVLTDPVADPNIGGATNNILTFYNRSDDAGGRASNACDVIDASGGNDSIVITFSVQSNCYVDGTMNIDLYYYDCCEDTQYHNTATHGITANEPSLTTTKTRAPAQPDCGSPSTWTITVTNNGAGNAQVVRVVDTPGAWLDYEIGSFTTTIPGVVIHDLGGGQYGWEFNNLASGNSAVFTLQTNLNPVGYPNQADCAATLRTNSVSVDWACGTSGDAVDNNPSTIGYDCSHNSPVTASANLTMSDLRVTDLDIQLNCSSDGVFTRQVRAFVSNAGTGPVSVDFTVSVTDGTWTGTGEYTGGNLAAGGTAWVNIDTTNWSASCNGCVAYSLTATADTEHDICECNESNNTYTEAYTPAIPDIVVSDIDFSNVTCSSDGISGNVRVQVRNNGCASSGAFQVSLATDGCLTFSSSVGSPSIAAGGSRWLTFIISGSWADCSDGSCEFTATADPAGAICECDGSNNVRTETFNTTLADLEVTDIDFTNISCTSDDVSGFVRVTVRNRGYGNATNFQVSLATDGCLSFSNQTVSATLSNGQTATVDFPVSGSMADCTDCSCVMTAAVDSGSGVCECDGTNNTRQETFTSTLPDLRVNSVTPTVTCNSDGDISGEVSVAVENIGCGASGSVVVRLTSDCGMTFSDQTISLDAGASDTVVFTLPADCDHCNCNFTATIDPGNLICECDGSNNSASSGNFTPNLPDLEVQDINFNNISCSADSLSGYVEVTIRNVGCVSAANIPVRLETDGCLTFTPQTVALLAAGASTTLQFNISGSLADATANSCEFTVTMDPNHVICECGDANNVFSESWYPNLPDLRVTDIDFSNLCNSDAATGTVRVTVTNQGPGVSGAFQVSLSSGGCLVFSTNQNVASLASGSSITVDFTPDANWSNCATCNCEFTAVVDPGAGGGAVCEGDGANNTYSETFAGLPDLEIVSVASTIECLTDGSLTGTTVEVRNNGCASAVNAVVRLSSDCGLTFTDQTVSLNAGQTTSVFFPFTSGLTGCTCTFNAVIDPDNAICECDGTDNSGSAVRNMIIPDLEIQTQDFAVDCAADGKIQIRGTVTLVNNGCGSNFTDNIPMRFTLYGAGGCSGSLTLQWTEILSGADLPSAGGTQTFTIRGGVFDVNSCASSSGNACRFSMMTEVDYSGIICEWDGTDNTLCSDITSQCLDLEAVSADVRMNCQSDGVIQSSVAFTLRNSGSQPITSDFSIRMDDGMGWTTELKYNADLGGTLPLLSGASSTVQIAWTRSFDPSDLSCGAKILSVLLDSAEDICQCSSENDSLTTAYAVQLPNLRPTGIEPACSADGTYTIRVTVENNGCSAAGASMLRLRDNLGRSIDKNMDSLAPGSSAVVEFTGWPSSCEPPSVLFTATTDIAQAVCELDNADNSLQHTYTQNSPDLQFTQPGIKPQVRCNSPGSFSASMDLSMQNNGNAPVITDFKIIVSDGQGWTTEKYYAADLGGTLPIAPGQPLSVRIPWNRDFAKEPFKCNFNNITARIDGTSSVCECASGNNETFAVYRLPFSNLSLRSVVPVCANDGRWDIEIEISNNGCIDQAEDFSLVVSDSAGKKETRTFTQLGGVLPFKTGEKRKLVLTGWPYPALGLDFSLTVTLESTGACDLSPNDNAVVSEPIHPSSDFAISDISWTCDAGDLITITFTVVNANGTTGSAVVPVQVFDETGKEVFRDEYAMFTGVPRTYFFTLSGYAPGVPHTFRFVVDGIGAVCESRGDNNEKSAEIICQGGGEPQLRIGKFCPPGQGPGGLFLFEIRVENTGASPLYHVRVEDYLPDGFRYVKGSSILGNQQYADPTGERPLVWNIERLEAGASLHLYFNAVADADIDPGRYCNELKASASRNEQGGAVVDAVAEKVRCCTVVTREPGAGCCLRVEIVPLAPMIRPDGPMSFIEPYFHTGDAMLAAYASLNLWRQPQLESGSMPEFMRARLRNYALSTMEQFYLQSGLGLALSDGGLWLAFGGAHPEREKDPAKGWRGEHANNTMTLSQMAFELLALDSALQSSEITERQRNIYLHLVEKKLLFLSSFPTPWPQGWEIRERRRLDSSVTIEKLEEYIRKLDDEADLYGRSAIYWALSRLAKGSASYSTEAARLAKSVRPSLEALDDRQFDPNVKHEEFLFILALLENGEMETARAKTLVFERLLKDNDDLVAKDREKTGRDSSTSLLDAMKDFAMAASVEFRTGGTMGWDIMERMRRKFYIDDTGVFADLRPDQTFKLNLESAATLTLAVDQLPAEKWEAFAVTLYRTFDEVGLFLKKRNLVMGDALYSLLKNYPFIEPFKPVLNFTRAKEDVVPVFSKDAVIYSTQLKPLGELLTPATFSRILSPSYETDAGRIAFNAATLQFFGGVLMRHGDFALREEGRSFWNAGVKHLEALITGGSGLMAGERLLLPHQKLAIRGPREAGFNMEPVDAGYRYRADVLADYSLAETLHIAGKGKLTETISGMMEQQSMLCAQFELLGYIPAEFDVMRKSTDGQLIIKPGPLRAGKLTTAKLSAAFPRLSEHLIEKTLEQDGAPLEPEDAIFFRMYPQFVKYFRKELEALVAKTDSEPAVNSADILVRCLLKQDQNKIDASMKNLLAHWDKQTIMPSAGNVEHIEKGLIMEYLPRQMVLYLMALWENNPDLFQFRRTLNLYSYLLENEWGLTWREQSREQSRVLPSSGYYVFREPPREVVEPGDMVRFRVRVDNTCPDGFVRGGDLGALFLKADFTPPLISGGTEWVDGLQSVGDFRWRYGALASGSYLEYMFYAFAPYDFRDGFVNGAMYAGGGRGYEDFEPGSGAGDRCEDLQPVKGLRFLPYEELRGLVFEDRNADGVKNDGEAGIANILIKDTRGRVFRSDGEGRFIVLAGEEHEGLQLELRSLPPQYVMLQQPTKLVNRNYRGEVYFPLVPCRVWTGWVYEDANGDGVYNEGEPRPEGVAVAAGTKRVLSGANGEIVLRNLPELWVPEIAVAPEQPFYTKDKGKLRIQRVDATEKNE